MKTLSIIIPVFNEENTILNILNIIKEVKLIHDIKKEIILIDDKSTDKSVELIQNYIENNLNQDIKLIKHEKNQGKGAAIHSGINFSNGDYLIIQDADLEYDPKDYAALIKPFKYTDADVVYGSRFMGGKYVRLHFFWHFVANKLLTLITNIVTNLNMTDMETGYKLFKKSVIQSINIKEKSFGVEPEITVKLAKKKYIFYEVPISYQGRSYDEGKKITLKDAFLAFYCIFKYRFFD